jgi:hypothetical protein
MSSWSSGVWSRAERDQKREAARALGVAVELHYLDVPFDELARRVEAACSSAGPVSITAAQLAGYATLFEAPGDAELGLYDPQLRPSAADQGDFRVIRRPARGHR